MIAGRAGSDLGDKILRQHFRQAALQRFGARNGEQILELRIPGFDAVFQVHGDDADFERLDDILAEIFQALDLHRLLFEGMIEAGVFNGDGHVSGDGEKQFEVVTGEVIAVHGLAEAQNRDGSFAETTRNEIIQVELFERAANGFGFLQGGARRFEEQAAALERRTSGVQERQIQRAFWAQTHGARKHELSGRCGIFQKHGEAINQQRLRNTIEHRADEWFQAHFVGERAAEFDERAAVIEAIAVEETVEARLHPLAQRLDQKRGDDDRDDAAGGAGGKTGAVKQFADQAIIAK